MRKVYPLLLVSCLLALPAGCNSEQKPSSENSAAGGPAPAPAKNAFGNSPLVGRSAPEFSLPTLTGGTASDADLKGRVTIVDFWATWCEPCRRSMPHVQKLSADPQLSARGLRVLAVNATNQDDRADVEAYIKEAGFTFPVALDENGTMVQAFQVQGFPTTLIVGRDGKVRNAFLGAVPAKALDEAVMEALK